MQSVNTNIKPISVFQYSQIKTLSVTNCVHQCNFHSRIFKHVFFLYVNCFFLCLTSCWRRIYLNRGLSRPPDLIWEAFWNISLIGFVSMDLRSFKMFDQKNRHSNFLQWRMSSITAQKIKMSFQDFFSNYLVKNLAFFIF